MKALGEALLRGKLSVSIPQNTNPLLHTTVNPCARPELSFNNLDSPDFKAFVYA